jgi:hypothetical protein
MFDAVKLRLVGFCFILSRNFIIQFNDLFLTSSGEMSASSLILAQVVVHRVAFSALTPDPIRLRRPQNH